MLHRLKRFLKLEQPQTGIGTRDDWRSIETRLDFRFPADYFEFCFHYGIGHIRDSSIRIDVLNPLSKSFDSRCGESLGSAARLSGELDPNRYQIFAVYPDRPGLFPWAMDDLGNEFFWYTSGEPDHWKVVIHDRGRIEYVATDLGMSEFLLRCMDRSIDVGPYTEHGFFPDPEGIVFVGKEYLTINTQPLFAFDETPYDVYVTWGGHERLRVIAAVGNALCVGAKAAREFIDRDQPAACGVTAMEVQHLHNKMKALGLGIRTRPTFRWPLD